MAADNIQDAMVYETDYEKKYDVKVFSCPRDSCNKRRFASAFTLRRHMAAVHGKNFECPIDGCGEVFDSRHALSKHKKKHKRSFSCDRCSSSFVEQKYLDAHKTRYHPEDSFGVSKRFCLQCEAQFDTYGELEYHINETHNKRTKFELVETAYKLKHQDWRMMLGKFYSVIILQKNVVQKVASSLNLIQRRNQIIYYTFYFLGLPYQPEALFKAEIYNDIFDFLFQKQQTLRNLKFQMVLVGMFESTTHDPTKTDTLRKSKYMF